MGGQGLSEPSQMQSPPTVLMGVRYAWGAHVSSSHSADGHTEVREVPSLFSGRVEI